MSRGRINIECAFGMLTQKFLILGRAMPWAWFSSPCSDEDFTKPRLLLRVCCKLHNACVDERIEELGSVVSNYAGGFETPEGREKGKPRGVADLQPTMASGFAPGSGAEHVPLWDDETAADHMPSDKETKKAEKDEERQINNVSRARVLLTKSIAASGVQRPDPSMASANIRAARRARQAWA